MSQNPGCHTSKQPSTQGDDAYLEIIGFCCKFMPPGAKTCFKNQYFPPGGLNMQRKPFLFARLSSPWVDSRFDVWQPGFCDILISTFFVKFWKFFGEILEIFLINFFLNNFEKFFQSIWSIYL